MDTDGSIYLNDASVPNGGQVFITATQKNSNNYTVTLPAGLVKDKVKFYAYVIDSRTVATSSYMD